jgi:hypothetical protein
MAEDDSRTASHDTVVDRRDDKDIKKGLKGFK